MRRLYRIMIEIYWWIEHRNNEKLAVFGFRGRKRWEHKYVDRFNENIYGGEL